MLPPTAVWTQLCQVAPWSFWCRFSSPGCDSSIPHEAEMVVTAASLFSPLWRFREGFRGECCQTLVWFFFLEEVSKGIVK